jgi:hypothetical protein
MEINGARLLGRVRRPLDDQHVELELVRSLTPGVQEPTQRVTHLRYRVRRTEER